MWESRSGQENSCWYIWDLKCDFVFSLIPQIKQFLSTTTLDGTNKRQPVISQKIMVGEPPPPQDRHIYLPLR